MSALPLKADIRQHEWHVRLVPSADIDVASLARESTGPIFSPFAG